jgi:hypothetical protein
MTETNELYECLAEFVRIDEESNGLYAHPEGACDLVLALVEARRLLEKTVNEEPPRCLT